jgi:diguanylate cyclase (GGDEF)-like protein
MDTSPCEAGSRVPADADARGRALLDALESAVIACDPAGRLLYANPAALRLWGLKAQPAGELAIAAFSVREETADPVPDRRHPLSRALRGETVRNDVFRVGTPDGAGPEICVSAHPFTSPAARLQGALMTSSQQRESARELRLATYVSDFEILTEVSRLLADVQDAEEAGSIICTVATGSTGAIAVLLWELEQDTMTLRWQEGLVSGDELNTLIDQVRPGALRVIEERARLVEHPPTSPDAPALPGTAWYEPLITSGRATGALAIVWPGVLGDLKRPAWLIEALAHHAATALERAELVRRLNAAARTDELTGVANRRVWNERLEHELARAQREEQPLSLVLIDLDNFKAYNDALGHPAGDALLRECAVAWIEQLRTTDVLARIGGEEFGVLLPTCPPADAFVVAERLRSAMPGGQTCSLGVATWDGTSTPSQLYSIADSALYRAKTAGRDRAEAGPGGEPLSLA